MQGSVHCFCTEFCSKTDAILELCSAWLTCRTLKRPLMLCFAWSVILSVNLLRLSPDLIYIFSWNGPESMATISVYMFLVWIKWSIHHCLHTKNSLAHYRRSWFAVLDCKVTMNALDRKFVYPRFSKCCVEALVQGLSYLVGMKHCHFWFLLIGRVLLTGCLAGWKQRTIWNRHWS